MLIIAHEQAAEGASERPRPRAAGAVVSDKMCVFHGVVSFLTFSAFRTSYSALELLRESAALTRCEAWCDVSTTACALAAGHSTAAILPVSVRDVSAAVRTFHLAGS